MIYIGAKPSLLQEVWVLSRLGLPVVAAQLLLMSMSFVDTVMSGHYAAPDLAAVAVGFSLFSPVLTFASGVLMALSPVIAQSIGSRRFASIGTNVRQTIWISILLTIPAMLLLRNLYPVMEVMGINPEVQEITTNYLKALSWGTFPTFAFLALRYFHEGLGNTRPAMFFAIIGLIVNILGNYTLIYGHFGFPELGGVGSGWASTAVVWIMFICMISYTAYVKTFRRFRLFQIGRGPVRHHIVELLKLGLPIGVSSTMEVTMFAVTALLMGSLGTIAVAGHQIALNFAAIMFMIPFGLSTAITVRVGLNKGRGDASMVRFSGFTGIGVSTLIMGFSALLIYYFAHSIAAIYTDDPEVLSVAVSLLYMAAIFQLSDGLQVSAYGALRGMKDTRIPMYVNLIAYWIVGLPLGYVLGFPMDLGPQGMWIGLIAGLTIAAVLHNIRFFIISKKAH